ncbi:MAG: hypothetical protein ACRDQD_22915 [Nocardioidaceae bacterium]
MTTSEPTLLDQLDSARDAVTTTIDELDAFNSFFIGYLANELQETPRGRQAWTKAVDSSKRYAESRRAAEDRKAQEAAERQARFDEVGTAAAALISTETAEAVQR